MRGIGAERDFAKAHGLVGATDGELAVLEYDVALGGFEEMRGDLFRLRFDLVERLHERGNADRTRPGPVGAHAELHLVRVPMHHAHIVDRNAQPL